jgi:hypothetical protein
MSSVVSRTEKDALLTVRLPTVLMSNVTVVFDPYAAAEMHNIVQTMVANHNVASTGQRQFLKM